MEPSAMRSELDAAFTKGCDVAESTGPSRPKFTEDPMTACSIYKDAHYTSDTALIDP